MAQPAAGARREHVPLGILYMTAATLMFAAGTALTKWTLATYPPGEVTFIRQIFSLLLAAIVILPGRGLAVFKTQRLGQHAMRGLSQFTSQMCLVLALMLMPLGAAMSISFAAPLFAVLYSVLFFTERVGIHRAVALVLGFAGVLLVTEPGQGGFGLGALFALANAMIYASVTVAVRRMSLSESAETLTMYQMVALTILMSCLLPFGFIQPTAFDVGLLAVCGFTNAIGQLWWTRALKLAPTSSVMPFYYMSLVWAIGLGWLVWGEVPSLSLLAGGAVVMASGLYLIWREKVAAARRAAAG